MPMILIGVAFAGSDCLIAHDVTAFENRQPGLRKITCEVNRGVNESACSEERQ